MTIYSNKVYHCGISRTGTTVVKHLFEKTTKRLNLDIESTHTGHKLWPKEYTDDEKDESALGRILILRNPFHILNSMINTTVNPHFDKGREELIKEDKLNMENIFNYLNKVLVQIAEFGKHGVKNDAFVMLLRYESYLPDHLDDLIFDFHDYLQLFSSKGIIPKFKPLAPSQMTEFQNEMVEEFGIKNQLKIIKDANLKTYYDIEEVHGLHGNHISSGDGHGSSHSLTDSQKDRCLKENRWFFKIYGYLPVDVHIADNWKN